MGGVCSNHFAAEVLPVGVLDPAQHGLFVRQIVGVLEVVQPHHQARWQRRLTRTIAVHLAELAARQLPVDQTAEPDQLVLHVDDLIEPRPEQVVLPFRLLPWPHARLRPDALRNAIMVRGCWESGAYGLARNPDPGAEIRQLPAHRLTSLSRQINSFPVLHGRLIKSVEDNGIGRNANIYAELGSTWRFVMRDPTTAAHLLASS